MISALFRLSRFRRIFRRPATRRGYRRWGSLGPEIRIEALDRGDSWTSCQLEPLEQRKVLDADFYATVGEFFLTFTTSAETVTFVNDGSTTSMTLSSGVFNGTDSVPLGVSGNGTNTLTFTDNDFDFSFNQSFGLSNTNLTIVANTTVYDDAFSVDLNASTSTVVLDGSYLAQTFTVENVAEFSLNGTVSTSGEFLPVRIDAPIVLQGDSVINNTFGNITLSNTIDGSHSLTLSSQKTVLGGAIGASTPLTDFTATVATPGTVSTRRVFLGGNVATTGSITMDSVALTSDVTVTSGAGSITIAGGTTAANHTLTVGDANQTGAISLGVTPTVEDMPLILKGLVTGTGSFDLTIDGINVTDAVSTVNNGTNTFGGASIFQGGLDTSGSNDTVLNGSFGGEGIVTYGNPVVVTNLSGGGTIQTGDSAGASPAGADIEITDANVSGLILAAGTTGNITINGTLAVSLGIFAVGDRGLTVNADASIAGQVFTADTAFTAFTDQRYLGNVSLSNDLELVGSTATFANGLDGQGFNLDSNLSYSLLDQAQPITNVATYIARNEAGINGTTTFTSDATFLGNVTLLGDAGVVTGTGFAGFLSFGGLISDNGNGYDFAADASGGDIGFDDNLSFGNLTANGGDIALRGANNTLGFGLFTTAGLSDSLRLGDDPTDRNFFALGVDALGVVDGARPEGTLISNGAVIALRRPELNSNVTIDTTNNGAVPAGAAVELAGGVVLDGNTLTTVAGTNSTVLTGSFDIDNGALVVAGGNLDFGNASTPVTINTTADVVFNVASGGALNVFNGSAVNGGSNSTTFMVNTLNIAPAAGNITSAAITLTPATAGRDVFVGSATGAGLVIAESAFGVFQSPTVTIGGSGYNGTITVSDLTLASSRLDLIATGSAGEIRLDGDFVSTATNGPDGVALFVYGSGSTFVLNGSITSANAVVIDDAVRVDNGSHAINTAATGANITITGGNAGIYATLGQTNGLTIDAGSGAVVLGNQTGFGDDGGNEALVANLTVDAGSTSFGTVDQELGAFTLASGNLDLASNITATGDIFLTALTTTELSGSDVVINSTGGDALLVGSINGTAALDVQGANVTLGLGGAITTGGLTAAATDKVSVAGTITIAGDVSLDAGSNITLVSGITTTAGNITTLAPVILSGNVTLDAGNDSINLTSTVDGTKASSDGLTLLSFTAFGGDVGGAVPIGDFVFQPADGGADLAVNVTAATVNISVINNNAQISIFGDVESGTVLTSTVGDIDLFAVDDIRIGHAVAAGNLTAVALNEYVSVGFTQYSGSISAGGSVNLSAGGDSVYLTQTTITANDSILLSGLNEYVEVDGSIAFNTSAGNGDMNLGLVFLGSNNFSFADVTIDAGAGSVTASGLGYTDGYELNNATILSAGSLTLLSGNTAAPEPRHSAANRFVFSNITGTATLGNMVVGANAASPALLVDAGEIVLNGPITTGTLTSPAVIGFNATAGNVTLTTNGTLDVNGSLTVDATGDALLRGDITTSGNQTYNAPMVLAAATTLTGDALSRTNAILGSGNDLTLNFAQTTALDSCVTGVGNLTSRGDTTISGAITTAGGQAYGSNVTLLSSATLTGTAGSFSGGVAGGGNDLSLNFTSPTVLSGVTNVADLSSTGPVLVGGTLATTGQQIYSSNVTLAADTTIEASSAGFALGVTGAGRSLTLDVACVTRINGNFTGIANLTSLGAVDIEGNITTIGPQNYAASVTLIGDAVLTASETAFVPNYANPTPAANIGTPGSAAGIVLSSNGKYVYIADSLSGLQIIDVSNIGSPTPAGNLDTSGNAYRLAISSDGQYAFIADDSSGLQIIDITNVFNPTLAGNVDTSGGAFGVALSSNGQYAFIGDGNSGLLEIIDVSNVAAPTIVGNVGTGGAAGEVAVSPDGQYVFVADFNSGLQIIDVTNVANPTLVNNFATSGGAFGVTLSSDGQYAFVADSTDGLQIINVSNVANPTLAGNLDTSGYAVNVVLSSDGGHAFLADFGSGLQIINVANVANPELSGNLVLSGDAYGVALSSDGGYAFVADGSGGLQIVSLGSMVTVPGSISFGSTVDGGFGLTANGSVVTFIGTVGNAAPLASLTTTANTTAIIAGGTIETTGNQTYGGEVSLSADAELIGDTGSFAAGVEGNTNSLTLNFTSESAIGNGFANLANLTSIGDVATNGTITTLNDQTYLANVTLAGDTTLTGNDVTFTSGVVGGGNDLTLNFAQTTAIAGIAGVGNLTSLGNVSLAGTVATIGAQDYQADATLAAATTIQGASATFSGGLTGNGQDLSLNLSGGAVIDSQIAGVANLTAISDVSINGTVTTTGSQTYQANATLVGSSNLTGSAGTFAAGVIGDGNDLTLNFAATTAIDGNFAGITNLTSLGDVTLEGNISTIGEQNYAATTTLLADTVVAVGQGSFTPDFGNMSVTDTVGTGYYAQGVAISSNGRYAFVAAGYYGLRIVDAADPTNLTVVSTEKGENSDALSVSLSPDEQYAFLADEYYGLMIIDVSDVNNPTLVSSLQFGGSGAFDVALSPDGQTAYVIADNANLAAVDVSNVAQPSELRSLALPGGGTSVAVSPDGRYVFTGEGYPTYIFQIADVQNGASLTPVSNFSSGHVPYSITLSSTGEYAFASQDNYGIQIINVANVAVPTNVSVISGRSDSSAVSSDDRYLLSVGSYRLTVYDVIDVANPAAVGNIAERYAATGVALSPDGQFAYTTGDYGLAAIRLGALTPGGLARATFGGTVNGAFHLTVDDGLNGTTFFNGEVGGSTPLASLTTEAGGTTTIAGGTINTAGNQTYGDVVNLAADAELIGDAGSFAAGVEGNTNSLTLNFTNESAIGNGFANLTNLTSIGDVATNGTISTINDQTYQAGFRLAGNTTLTGNAATFAESIAGGGQSLDLNFTNTTTLEGATNLASLASVGDIAVRGLLETTGTQAYDGGLQLFGDASLVGNTGTFATGVTGAGNSLSLNFSEPTQINGNFTGIDDLTVVGQANVDGSIATTGNQTYQSAIYLIDNATLTSGAGAISAAAVADGGEGNSLTVGDANQTGSVTLGGNLSFGSLSSGAGAFAVTLSGANNTLASVSLLNTGNLSIGTSAASRTFATNGFTAPAVATSFLAGTVTTDSGVITLNATSLTANAVLDSTNNGASNGAAILLANGTLLNSFRLETFGGESDTEVTGDTVVSDGELIVETGSLNLGTPSQPGTLTATQDSLIQVANGAFNVFNGSTIEAGNNALTIQTNALQVDSGAGNITAGSLTLLPATNGTNIFLGTATGPGLEISQNAFDVFRAPLITIGEAGYNGTVDVGDLQVPDGRLDIIANGTGGTVRFDGDFTSTAAGVPGGIGLFVEGSGATTTINGTITSNTAVVINDSVVVTDGNHTIDTSGTNANITITGGTAGIYGAANQTNSLTINAGNGTVILGNQTGFGDNSGAAALLEDVTISAGSTLLGSVPSEINGTFSVLTGDIAVSGNLTAAAINFATSGGTTLGSDVTLTTTSGGVDIAGPIDGGFNLSINAALGTTFGGVIGGTTPLNVLEVVESGGTTTLGGNVTTTSHQFFQNPVALAANATLTGESSILDSVEGGGYSLVLDYLCGTSIGSGGIAAENLASLTVANGITSINGSIETAGAQVYSNGSVALLGTTVLQGDSLVIGKSLSAQLNDLTLNFAQTTAVDGSTFSDLANLTSLGPVALSGQIDSAGFQNYAAAATLSADTTLNATGNIDFGSLVDGARQLTIQSGGNVNLFAALGSTTPLQGLNLASAAAVTALGTLAIDGTGGTGAGLRIGDGVNNVNIAQPGSTITAATTSGILLAGNTTGSTIGGFTITNSGSHGIEAAGGDYTGTGFVNSSVTSSAGDGFHAANATGLTAVLLRSAANAKAGIRVAGASSNVTVSGSIVGLDANGTAAQPNLGQGIVVSAATGTTLQGNTISGNGFYGVVVTGSAANTTISNNRIGTGTDGTTAIGNGQSGVFVLAGATGTSIVGNQIRNNNGMAGIQVVDGTSNTTIGGTAGDSNLLVGNGLFGITVSGNVSGTRVLGNLVSSHTTSNIYLNNAQNLTVGSSTSGEDNTFDASDYGVYAGGDLTGTTIAGNTFQQHTLGGMVLTNAGNLTVRDNTLDDNGAFGLYGTGDLTGTTIQGNTISNHTVGVLVDNGANLTIGSGNGTLVSDPDANVITKNTTAGIVVNGAGSQNVSILSNSIFENDFIGISLSAGGNALARTPTLATASTTAVTGSITGTDGDVYRIQYFKSADEVTTSSRSAQGQELIGYQDVTISGGSASIDEDISGSSVIVTDWVTATATLLVGGLPSETSQFSFGIRVTA